MDLSSLDEIKGVIQQLLQQPRLPIQLKLAEATSIQDHFVNEEGNPLNLSDHVRALAKH